MEHTDSDEMSDAEALKLCVEVFCNSMTAPGEERIRCGFCFILCKLRMFFVYRIVTKENRRKKHENQISFLELMGAELDENPHLTLGRERYFKQNRKRRKKGLFPLSQEEFLHAELKKCHRRDKKTYFYILLPFVIAIIL